MRALSVAGLPLDQMSTNSLLLLKDLLDRLIVGARRSTRSMSVAQRRTEIRRLRQEQRRLLANPRAGQQVRARSWEIRRLRNGRSMLEVFDLLHQETRR